jgi:MinD-like ATPase involved in chromosome partitioning or flagellar assembly
VDLSARIVDNPLISSEKAAENELRRDHNVPFLGSLPFDPEVRKAGDEGRPFIIRQKDSPTWKAVDTFMEHLVSEVEKQV